MTASPSNDRPQADSPAPTPPVVDSPPLAPREHSSWWSAPSGKPIGIPDFAHEFVRAILAWLFPTAPQPVPVRVKSGRR
jgi:hypothetical protein